MTLEWMGIGVWPNLPYDVPPDLAHFHARIRCVANFENLAVALSCWTEKVGETNLGIQCKGTVF